MDAWRSEIGLTPFRFSQRPSAWFNHLHRHRLVVALPREKIGKILSENASKLLAADPSDVDVSDRLDRRCEGLSNPTRTAGCQYRASR